MKATNAALATDTAVPHPTSPEATRARIDAYCTQFNLTPPKLKVWRGKVYINDELVNWCDEAGASLDWILIGDMKCMVDVYRKRALQDREFRLNVNAMPDEQVKLLADCLEDYKRKVEALRASKVTEDLGALRV